MNSLLVLSKSTVIGSNLFRPSPFFNFNVQFLLIVVFGFSISANADVVSQRKAGFKTNAASMKAIASAIGVGDYQTVINEAKTISSWAHKIDYFPEGSRFGDTKAGSKYGQILTILRPYPRQMKPRRTNWLQRQNLAIQAR